MLQPLLLSVLTCLAFGACASPREVDPAPVTKASYRYAAERLTAVVVSEEKNIKRWVGSRFSLKHAPRDAEGGSASPIAPDGYFLTADHVLESMSGRQIWVIYGNFGKPKWAKARVVWRSRKGDIALLKADIDTPHYYEWAPSSRGIPVGTPVLHAGIATGFRSGPGKLASAIRPDSPFHAFQMFKHDVPLQPGDSGGPVLDAHNRLIGVNSAVEFLVPLETAFFIESEGSRPSLSHLNKLIENDRRRYGRRAL